MNTYFVGGTYIRSEDEPEWSDYHKRYYVGGYRFIKSKKKFSGNRLLHNFTRFVKLDENEVKCFEQSLNV